MKFGRYASLLGFGVQNNKRTNEIAKSDVVDTTTHLTNDGIHTAPTTHHNHHHATSLHPTMQAYIHQAQIKDRAIDTMQQILLDDHNAKMKKREETNYRPLIVTNHLPDETIYPAYSSSQQSGGFELKPGESYTEKLPLGELNMFRVWIRRGCTKGKDDKQLHCLTGDCNNKLVCDSWGTYGVTAGEIAIFPNNNPPSMYPDLSYVESSTMIPISFSVDGCLQISCDPTGINCPANMQVKDSSGKLLECACGASDWNLLLQSCPNEGGAEIQKQVKEKCPDVYSFAHDDSAQKYCPFNEKAAIRVDVGVANTNKKEAKFASVPNQQIINVENKDGVSCNDKSQVTNAPDKPILFQDSWTDTDQWKSWRDAGYPT